MAESKIKTPARRQLTNRRTLELMMAVLIQSPSVFAATKDILTPTHLLKAGQHLSVVWSAVLHFYTERDQLPDIDLLRVTIEDICDNDPGALNETEYEETLQFLDWAFAPDVTRHPITDDIYKDWAIPTVKRFLQERLAEKLSEDFFQRNTVIVDFPEQSRMIAEETEKIDSIDAGDIQVAYPDTWADNSALELQPTDIAFIDAYLGGGTVNGEVYGLLGPFGSCKSTIAYMLAINAAKQFHARAVADPDAKPMVSVIVSYEDDINTMRRRGLGYCAEIPRSTIEILNTTMMRTELSTSERLKDYEKRKYIESLKHGDRVMGETERVQHAIKVLNNHILYLDMRTRPGVGGGGIDEIPRAVSQELRRRNALCGMTILDYTGAMVQRYIEARDLDPERVTRYLIKSAPLKAKNHIADVFNCPVFMLQQLSGAANDRGTATLSNHTDAAEAKSFAENLDFAFNIGKPNLEQLALFGCTKHRRQPPRAHTIIHVDGDFNRVHGVDDRYKLDTSRRTIVPRATFDQVQTTLTGKPPGPQGQTQAAAVI